jgi:hypothetical protein
MLPKPALSPDEILKAEYDYIAKTVFQANEDRARVTSFYLVTFGSFIAALVSAQLNGAPEKIAWAQWGFIGLFLALALMGLVTILQLARLRMAWFESVQTMNAIKEYYILEHPDLAMAIKWRSDSETMPAKLKLNSVSFLLVLQVAFLGAAALGAAIFFVVRVVSDNVLFLLLPTLVGGIAFLIWQLYLYRSNLR